MIASKNVDAFWVFYFVGEEEAYGFDALTAAVHIVA